MLQVLEEGAAMEQTQSIKLIHWLNPFTLLRKTYDWTLKWSEHRYSQPALCTLAFTESIFFPVPTDVLLMLMGAARPKKALHFAFLAAAFSVIGAFGGYALGAFAWYWLEPYFIGVVTSAEVFEKVGVLYEENAFWTVFMAAFTPIPFKVCTVAAGVFSVPLLPFFVGAALGRSLRFFIVGALLFFFGAPVKGVVEKYFNTFTILFTVLLVGGFAVIKYLF